MIWIVLLAILFPIQAYAVTVPHAFTEVNTQQSTTSTTYVDVSGASITSGNFTAGKNYFIQFCGQFSEDGSSFGWVRAVHGSTAFAESEQTFYRSSTNVDNTALCWFTVWTAVSSEDFKIQYRHNSGTQTVTANFVAMVAIQLSDYLTSGTDYCFAESATDEALSTTPDDGGSCTVTPSSSSTWLAMTYAQVERSDITTRTISRIVRSGEASSSLPAGNILPEASASELWGQYLTRVYTFGASSNTIKEQSEASATANTRYHSSVFLLNLSKFAARAAAYTEAATSLTTTTMTQVQTASISPPATGDVLIGASFILDKTASSSDVEFRVQVDNTDQPAGQTTGDLDFDSFNATDTANDIPIGFLTMANLSAGAHTIDLDANRNTNSDVKYLQVWAFTFELASSRRRTAQREVE